MACLAMHRSRELDRLALRTPGMRSTTWSRGARLGAITLTVLLPAALVACGDDDEDTDVSSQTTETTEAASGSDSGTTDPYGGGGDTGGDAAMGEGSITAKDFQFSEAPTVAAGSEVTFVNEDTAPHTLTADDDAFDSGNVAAGEKGSITAPGEPGEYAFHCEIHPSMTGTLTVE